MSKGATGENLERVMPSMALRDREHFIATFEDQGLSERGVARSAGLSHSTVNHLVTGRRQCCSPETARALEEALRAETGSLFAEVT
jgi:lambda repressor-like predicted transcriptional regulator